MNDSRDTDVVITGMGVASALGIGTRPFAEGLYGGRSGIRPAPAMDAFRLPVRIAGEVPDFDARSQGVPRKSIKVMPRDSQIGLAASLLACQDAGVANGQVDPERFGVVLGADRIRGDVMGSVPAYHACTCGGPFNLQRWGSQGLPLLFPLSFLRVLPNMIASHMAIVHDARGANNTIHHGEVSGLLAVAEAAQVIVRGRADVMLAGAASSRLSIYDWVLHCLAGGLSPRQADPATVMRPFDAGRDGDVRGEGAAVFVLESRRHAEARGATILARVASSASAFARSAPSSSNGMALGMAMGCALDRAGLRASDVGHVNAQGWSTAEDDPVEASALARLVPNVPVTAPRSYFGNLAAAGGAVEMAASVLAVHSGLIPATLNYQRPDPTCPVRVVRDGPLDGRPHTALVINWTKIGQAAAVVLTGES